LLLFINRKLTVASGITGVLITAVQELEKELGIHIDAVIPVELGGLNSAAPLDAAVQMGKKVIDADLAGRAVPEVAQTLPRLLGYPICPIACQVSDHPDKIIQPDAIGNGVRLYDFRLFYAG